MPYLKPCVNSILNQKYRNLEIILIDDGSTDGSGNVCDEYERNDSRITVIHKRNGGLSDARNAGLDLACGEYISFIDSDDWLSLDAYEVLYKRIKRYHADIICFGMIELYEKSEKALYLPRVSGYMDTQEALKKLMTGNECGPSVCNKIFKRSVFEKIRFPKGKISEDIAVTYRLFDHAGRIDFAAECFYYYRHRKNSITTAAYSMEHLVIADYAKEMIQYMKHVHPDLVSYARIYYANILINVCSRMSVLKKEEKKTFADEMKKYKKELIKYRCFLKTPEERMKYILVLTNLYGIILKLITKVKRGNF